MIGCGEKPVVEKRKVVVSEAQKDCGERLGTEIVISNSIGMTLVLIPPGEFMMGSPDSDSDAGSNWKPQHKVKITKPFYLGVCEVTQAEYETVMGKNPSWFSKGRGGAEEVSGEDTSGHPVDNVSWDDAVKFCRELSAKEGKTYRLPTEAEWEYACRAATTTRYSFGDDPASLGQFAWYEDNSDQKTHPVGEKKPNAWGLHDMHGNLREWCADFFGSDYYAVSPTDDPMGPETGSYRVSRGGSWNYIARYCGSSSRERDEPSYRLHLLGFRVVADLPSQSSEEPANK